MLAIRSLLLIALYASAWTVAHPVDELYKLVYERADGIIEVRQQATLTEPVTFQTVTTAQTQAGTIIQTCTVTLTPITAEDGSSAVLQEKQCKFRIDTGNGNGNGNGNTSTSTSSDSAGQTSTAVDSSATATATDSITATTIIATSSAAATGVPPISEIGVGVIPASQSTISSDSASSTSDPAASSTGSPPPAVSVIGTNQVPNSASDSANSASASSTATPVTVVTTLSDGQVSTVVSTPSAAAAQEAAATTPGRKLEVLPIGLGVFAGVSVIALIVVGLVTYERTKYRKAFRRRKLAEAGANMGYGGMAERT